MQYDLTFITNIPAFYKVNLFNRLNEFLKIKVIFISKTSEIRSDDFYGRELAFDHIFLSSTPYENRIKLQVLLFLAGELLKTKSKFFIFSGWETKEACLCSYLTPKNKNAIVVESSVLESELSGIKFFLKKKYLNRMSIGLPSGLLQKSVLSVLNFQDDIFITHGVGISNYTRDDFSKCIETEKTNNGLDFLYIGRLSPEKNLNLLIKAFNDLSHRLTIVGSGPQERELQKLAKSNILFLGYKNNSDLASVFKDSDVFILPSLSEPWGLVVEEALISGVPVLVSDKVGCKDDLVTNDVGLVFEAESINSLLNAIHEIEKNILFYKNNLKEKNYSYLSKKQLNVYGSLIGKNI